MEKLVKIAEIEAQSARSVKKIAEILEQSGFEVAYYEEEGYEFYLYVLEKRQ